MSRDAAGELGGMNLHRIVNNSVVNPLDMLGLLEYTETTKLTKEFVGSSPWDLNAKDVTKSFIVFVYQGAEERYREIYQEDGTKKCYCIASLLFRKGKKMIGRESRYVAYADIIAEHNEEFKESKILDKIKAYLAGKIPFGSELSTVKDIITTALSKPTDVKLKLGRVYWENEFGKETSIINSK